MLGGVQVEGFAHLPEHFGFDFLEPRGQFSGKLVEQIQVEPHTGKLHLGQHRHERHLDFVHQPLQPVPLEFGLQLRHQAQAGGGIGDGIGCGGFHRHLRHRNLVLAPANQVFDGRHLLVQPRARYLLQPDLRAGFNQELRYHRVERQRSGLQPVPPQHQVVVFGVVGNFFNGRMGERAPRAPPAPAEAADSAPRHDRPGCTTPGRLLWRGDSHHFGLHLFGGGRFRIEGNPPGAQQGLCQPAEFFGGIHNLHRRAAGARRHLDDRRRGGQFLEQRQLPGHAGFWGGRWRGGGLLAGLERGQFGQQGFELQPPEERFHLLRVELRGAGGFQIQLTGKSVRMRASSRLSRAISRPCSSFLARFFGQFVQVGIQVIQRGVFLVERLGGLFADAFHARDVIGRIADERLVIHHQARRHAEFRNHVFIGDVIAGIPHLAAFRQVDDDVAAHQLQQVAVSGDDFDPSPCAAACFATEPRTSSAS